MTKITRAKLFKMAPKMQTYNETSLLKRSLLCTTGLPTEYHRNPKIMCCVLLTSNAITGMTEMNWMNRVIGTTGMTTKDDLDD